MEHKDESPLEAWPPNNPTHDVWKKGWESIFRETQARLASERPELARDISLLTEEYMILQFHKAPDSDRLTVMHGLRMPMEGHVVGVKLSRNASNEILNNVDPVLRIEIAREMVWTHVIDVMDADDWDIDWIDDPEQDEEGEEKEAPWKDSNGESGMDFSAHLPELAGWGGGYEDEEDFEIDRNDEEVEALVEEDFSDLEEEDDSAFVEAANADPSLRMLYFAILHGKMNARLK